MNLNTRKFLSYLHQVISRGFNADCATGERSDNPLRYRALAWEKYSFPPGTNAKKVIVKDI